MRFSTALLVALSVAGCDAPPVRREIAAPEPPKQVQAGFIAFTDSLRPQLEVALRDLGYEPNWEVTHDHADSAAYAPEISFARLLEKDAKNGLYSASLAYSVHQHGTDELFEMEHVSLEFVTHGQGKTWALLTTDGLLFDLASETDNSASSLPIILQQRLVEHVPNRLNAFDWFAYEDMVRETGTNKYQRLLTVSDSIRAAHATASH